MDYKNSYRSSLEYSYAGTGENLTNGLVTFLEYPTLGFVSNGLMDNYAEGVKDNGSLSEIMLAHSDSCHALYRICLHQAEYSQACIWAFQTQCVLKHPRAQLFS